MNLRVKLLIGYMLFVVALVALGGWSAWRLREMSNVSRQIIAQNYDSVVAAQVMKESLERQDSASLFALLGHSDRARQQLRENRARFDEAFAKAAGNITEPGEAELIALIRRDRDAYYELTDRWFAAINRGSGTGTGADISLKPDTYFIQLEPKFRTLLERCDQLLQLNQQAMAAKSNRAATAARRWFEVTLLFAVTLVAAGIALAVFWSNQIVRPVKLLTDAATRIAGGDLNTKAEIVSRDEVGVLAAEFNRMAERIRQLRRTELGQLVIAQQTAEAALDSLDDPVVVTDSQGRVMGLNSAAEKLFGAENQVIGRAIEEITTDNRMVLAVRQALQSSTASVSAAPTAMIQSEAPWQLRARPIHDAADNLLGAVLLLKDVVPLREIDRLKTEFITAASRELREPLRRVQMDVHSLLTGATGELNDKQYELLGACREDGELLEKIMRDLLELTRLEAGEAHPQLVEINCEEVQSLAESWRLRVEAADLNYAVNIPPSLPAMRAGREELARIVGILIGNAIEHTPRGGNVTFTAAPNNHHITLSIADTGRGIQAEFLPRIFRRFVRVPGSPAGGAGLGLAIARRMVELQGGQISVQSEPGRGTVFVFSLPLEERGSKALAPQGAL